MTHPLTDPRNPISGIYVELTADWNMASYNVVINATDSRVASFDDEMLSAVNQQGL